MRNWCFWLVALFALAFPVAYWLVPIQLGPFSLTLFFVTFLGLMLHAAFCFLVEGSIEEREAIPRGWMTADLTLLMVAVACCAVFREGVIAFCSVLFMITFVLSWIVLFIKRVRHIRIVEHTSSVA